MLEEHDMISNLKNFKDLSSLISAIRISTLDNFWNQTKSESSRQLFCSIIDLKREGYGPPNYGEDNMPMECSDFVAWHHAFCIETKSGTEVIAAYKNISLKRCDQFHVTPPYLTLAKHSGAQLQEKVLQEVFEAHRQQNKHLICSSGFTIRPEIKTLFKGFSSFIKELLAALMVFDSSQLNGATIIGGGVPKFKTNLLWEKIGFNRMKWGDEPLPPIHLPAADDEAILFMQMSHASEWALSCFEKHKSLIENRIVFSGDANTRKLKAA